MSHIWNQDTICWQYRPKLDKGGFKAAKELTAILDLVLKEMENIDFPDRIAVAQVKPADNPFV